MLISHILSEDLKSSGWSGWSSFQIAIHIRFTPGNHFSPLIKAMRFMLYSSMIYGATPGVCQILKKATLRPRPYEIHQVRMTVALKIVIVTGGNIGLWYQTSLELARRNASVIIACCSLQKGRVAVESILK